MKRILTEKLYVKDPTPREVALLASLDETDDIKFTPAKTNIINEEPIKDEPVAEEVKAEPVLDEKVEEVKEEVIQPVEPQEINETQPVEEPHEEKVEEVAKEEDKEPVVEEVQEEKAIEEPDKNKAVVKALNDVPGDGRKAQEEKNEPCQLGGESRLDKKVICAINDLDRKEPSKEEPVEEPVEEEKVEPIEEPVKEEQAQQEVIKEVKEEVVAEETKEEVVEEPIKEEEKTEPVEEKQLEKVPQKTEPVKEEIDEEELKALRAKPVEELTEEERRKLKIRGTITEAVGESETSKIPGKFEVYPEDDEFKYRLKASNGEILVVSYGYTTRDGAHAGIETLKKNLETGVVAYITDKNNRSQWRLSTPNESRIIALGETYGSVSSARSAFASTQKFGKTERIIDLDEIPSSERRTWEFTADLDEEKDSGSIEIYDDGGKFRARLLANNNEVLFVTAQSYSTKQSLKASIDNIKEKLNPNAFHITKDKQERYQFVMESGSGFVYLVGESYSTAARARSAAASVLAFINKAEIVDLTLKSAKVDVELTGVNKDKK